MPIMCEYDKEQCKRYIFLSADSMSDEEDIKAILIEYDAALSDLELHLADENVYYQQICLEVKGIAPRVGLFYEAYVPSDPRDPWKTFCPPFWDNAITRPALTGRIDKLLQRLVDIVAEGSETAISCLSEGENTQLGEPLLVHLALRDKRFVRYFAECLQHWDLDSEVSILDARLQILETHGECDETACLM